MTRAAIAALLLTTAPAFAQQTAAQETAAQGAAAQETAAQETAPEPSPPAQGPSAVRGVLTPVNDFGAGVDGAISFTPEMGRLAIRMDAENARPGVHRAYVYGFDGPDPQEALCPVAESDLNDDGFVDVTELAPRAGERLFPLNEKPSALDMDGEGWPEANERMKLEFDRSADLEALRKAVMEAHGGLLALDRRVVVLHGAPVDAMLPESVASIEGRLPEATLPIACAELGPLKK